MAESGSDLHELLSSPDLVVLGLEADSAEQVIAVLAQRLVDGGHVRDTYPEAVMARERVHPTGLPAPGRGVAIPHADPAHVRQQAVALATMSRPVAFGVMGTDDATVECVVCILLALSDGPAQLRALRQVVELVQDRGRLERLVAADRYEDVVEVLSGTDLQTGVS